MDQVLGGNIFVMTQDMDLQAKCQEAGLEYLRKKYPSLESDIEKKHLIINACGAGYMKGYREAQEAAKCPTSKDLGSKECETLPLDTEDPSPSPLIPG